MKNSRLILILSGVAVLLLIPLVAMQFTTEVKWTLADFIAAGVLLLAAAIACEWVLRKVHKATYRISIVVGILIALVLIWLELAVGIFGSPIAGS